VENSHLKLSAGLPEWILCITLSPGYVISLGSGYRSVGIDTVQIKC